MQRDLVFKGVRWRDGEKKKKKDFSNSTKLLNFEELLI